ncbi:hypothetical protein SUGI_0580970 [Cryptomeria japonica]|uniref:large ribosomal subunit protein uL3c-like n=1 Tax=Cryptomeria japonica TaxID=3369 RepID=UPI002414CE24|nr:large ribosomal subunit protein uL3c-like [Cryptomeria japonica]GLJ29471.1 hypothetical protein SUGI_0580970 [Cryptomeria japonica]
MICMASYEAAMGVMGTKLGMMTYFEPEGKCVPVTVIGFHEGNIVTQIKTESTDGYVVVQVGYRRVRDTKLSKPELASASQLDAFQPNQRLNFHEMFA